MTTQDPLEARPDEKARRERDPEEAVDEMEKVIDNETTPTEDMPPLREPYGRRPDPSDRR